MWAMGMSQSHVANATYISADKLWSMGPAISVSGYEGAIADYVYWTSSREDYSGGEAWIVGAGRGTANTEDPDYAGAVKVGETWTTCGGGRGVRTYTH